MKLTPTTIEGAFIIDPTMFGDHRGFFASMYEDTKFRDAGLTTDFCRINNSLSEKRGTLRGMHYQPPPFDEVKLVRVIRGTLWDVVLDLRKDSPTFGQHFGLELSADNRRMLYVPSGCAHGFVTLCDDTEILYLVTNRYNPKIEKGLRWDDARFNISWPIPPTVLSDKDKKHPDFDPEYHLWY